MLVNYCNSNATHTQLFLGIQIKDSYFEGNPLLLLGNELLGEDCID